LLTNKQYQCATSISNKTTLLKRGFDYALESYFEVYSIIFYKSIYSKKPAPVDIGKQFTARVSKIYVTNANLF